MRKTNLPATIAAILLCSLLGAGQASNGTGDPAGVAIKSTPQLSYSLACSQSAPNPQKKLCTAPSNNIPAPMFRSIRDKLASGLSGPELCEIDAVLAATRQSCISASGSLNSHL